MGVVDGLKLLQWGSWPLHLKPFTSTQCQWGLWQYVLVSTYVLGVPALSNFPLFLHRYTAQFLVAYYLSILLFCVPLVYVQLKIGGVLQRHIVDLYGNCIPALKGVPWAMLALSFILCIYQSIYAAYSLQYAYLATRPQYPWGIQYNYTQANLGGSHIYLGQTRADTYFNKVFLGISTRFSGPGDVQLHLVVSLALVWSVLFLVTCRGPRMFGRICPFVSALGLICMLATLFFTQSSMPDVGNSLSNYVTNLHHTRAEDSDGDTSSSVLGGLKSSPLAAPQTWLKALEQSVYSLAVFTGVLPALGGYVGDRKHVNKVTPVIVLVGHALLPVLLSLTVIPVVNGLAVKTDTPLPDVMKTAMTGDLLWFVVIPEALYQLNTSHFWAFMLYAAYSVLLLNQQSVLLLALLENVRSTFQKPLLAIFHRQEFFTSAVCALGFLLGLPMVTQGGYFLLYTVQLYLYRGLFVLVLLSAIPTAYVYVKLDPIYMPIERKFITGWFLAASLVIAILMHTEGVFSASYLLDQKLTGSYKTIGVLTAVCPVLVCLLLGLLYALLHTQQGTLLEKLQEMITPSMARIYPPVVNTEPIDMQFSQFNGTLKTRNRFPRRGKSSKTTSPNGDQPVSPRVESGGNSPRPLTGSGSSPQPLTASGGSPRPLPECGNSPRPLPECGNSPRPLAGCPEAATEESTQPSSHTVNIPERTTPDAAPTDTTEAKLECKTPPDETPTETVTKLQNTAPENEPADPSKTRLDSVSSDDDELPILILKPYKLESTVPGTEDLAETPIETEVCIEGLEHATPV